MDTNPYLKLSTLTTFGLHSRGCCLIHRFDYGYHPFFYPKFPQGPPQNLPGHSVKRLFQIHKRQPQFLLLFQKPLLHLSNNKYRICGTFTSSGILNMKTRIRLFEKLLWEVNLTFTITFTIAN